MMSTAVLLSGQTGGSVVWPFNDQSSLQLGKLILHLIAVGGEKEGEGDRLSYTIAWE